MNDANTDVDQLLQLDPDVTGSYDVSFFGAAELQNTLPTATGHLADARIGLDLFITEANRALLTDELTVDQRVHVSTIVSFIEGLMARFDRVSVPGFLQPKRTT